MADQTGGAESPITIKKYANRRLYNTATSSYVTLDYLCQMVKDGVDFAVFDAKSGEDITRSVLTQIIVEEESKGGQNLLPISFLRQLISFYGDNMQQMLLPKYLDFSMKSFSENQEKMRHYMEDTFGSVFPFGQFEEMSKQNLAMFERTMQLFAPRSEGESAPENGSAAPAASPGKTASDIEALQKQIDAMQQQLKKIGEKSS